MMSREDIINKEEKPLLKPDFKTINPRMIYKDPDLHAYSLIVKHKGNGC